MKRAIIFLMLILGFNFVKGHDITKSETPDLLARAVFKALQEKSYVDFEQLICTDSDCEIMIGNATAPDSLKPVALQQMKALSNYLRQNAKENLASIIQQVELAGFDWAKTEFIDAVFEIKNRDNIESTDIVFLCKQLDKTFVIKLNNCHKSNAWLIMGQMTVKFVE